MTSLGGSYVYDEDSKYEENGKKTGHYDSTDWAYRYTSDHSRKEFVEFTSSVITGFGGFFVPRPTSNWSVLETTTTLHGSHYFDMGTASGDTKTVFETSGTPPVEGSVPINPYHYGDWPPVKAYTPGTQHIQNPTIAAVVGGAEWLNGLVHTGATPVDRVLESLPLSPLDGPLTPLRRTINTETGLISRSGRILDNLLDDTQHGWIWKGGVLVGTLLGDVIGVTDVSDAWAGEDTNAEKLSDSEITAKWLTGSAKLILTAVGIKGAAGSVLRTGPIAGKPVAPPKPAVGVPIGETPAGLKQFVGCFLPGTPVATRFGHKPIENVTAEDFVWACNLLTGDWELRQVVETYVTDYVGDSVRIEVLGEWIESTRHHPFWVVAGTDLDARPRPDHVKAAEVADATVAGRWVDAGDLRIGDLLLLKDGRLVPITAIDVSLAVVKVYNFQVEGLHNYAVGLCDVLVHNNAPCSFGPQSPGAYFHLGRRVFPTRANSGLSGESLRVEQKDFFLRGLEAGKDAAELRGQAAAAGYTRRGGWFSGNDHLADRGAENALQDALDLFKRRGS